MLMIRSNRHGAMARSSKSLLGPSHVDTNYSRLTHLLITRSQGSRGIIWYTRGTHVMNKNCYCQAFLLMPRDPFRPISRQAATGLGASQ
jgi:hypothetical protein